MSTPDDGTEIDQAARLRQSWAAVEPRIERLSRGPNHIEFFRRLHGEYRVAALYSETSCAAGMRRYAMELQTQGLRTMAFDGITGAAEYIVGAYIESLFIGTADVRDVYDRTAALINRAIALARPTTTDAHEPWSSEMPVDDAPRVCSAGRR